MKLTVPILIVLAFLGAGATYAIARAPNADDAHEDARETHACPAANATAYAHANASSALFHCDKNATRGGDERGEHEGTGPQCDRVNESAEEACEAASQHASAGGSTHAPNEHASSRSTDHDG